MSANGLIAAKQIRDFTGSASAPTSGDDPFQDLNATRDLADILSGAGTQRFHPRSLPIAIGSGLNYDATSKGFQLDIDGATLTAPGDVLTVTDISGLEVLPADFRFADSSGLIATGAVTGNGNTGLAINPDTSQGLSINGSDELTVANATTSTVGVVSTPTAGGLSVTAGAVSINVNGQTGTIDSNSLRINSGVLGVRDGRYVDRDLTGAATLQTIASGLEIAGANASSVAINLTNIGGARVRGVLTATDATDATPLAQVNSLISTATAGLNDPIAPANDFINAANATNGAIVNGGRYIALESNVGGNTNNVGDILVATQDDDIASATVIDAGGASAPDGSLINVGDALGVATASASGPGLYKYNDSVPEWGFLLSSTTTQLAVDNNPGPGVAGFVIPNQGLTVDGSGILNIKLASSNPGLQFSADGSNNVALGVLHNSTTMTITGSGVGVKDSGIDTLQLAAGAVEPTKINFNATSGLIESGTEFGINFDDSTIGLDGSDQLSVKDSGITSTKISKATNHFTGASALTLNLNATYLSVSGGSIAPVAGSSGAGPLNATHLDLGNGLKAVNATVDEEITLNIDTNVFEFDTGALTIADDGVSGDMLDMSSAGAIIYDAVGGNPGYKVQVDGSTIAIATNTLQVPDDGITLVKLKTDDSSPFISTGGGATQGITLQLDQSLEIVSNTLRVARDTFKKRKYFTSTDLTNSETGPSSNVYTYTLNLVDTYLKSADSSITPYRIWINDIEVGVALISEASATTISFQANAVNPTSSHVPYRLDGNDCVTVEYVDIS